MAFFKNILSDVLGDKVADILTSDTAKDLAKSAGKHAAESAMNTAAERASKAAVNKAVDGAANALNRRSPLETPPPPAVPTFESLSVMVAVNGQSYGPYERATLLEMIGNGSLTRETFVFIQGMSEWQKASDVEAVAALFASKTPAPPAPPMPWANASQSAPAPAQSDNSLSPRLNSLITAAIADGEISDLERQVLIRNAQEEGVAMDEFVMVLEARLYEQRQAIINRQKEAEAKQKSAEAAVAAATAATAATQATAKPKRPEVRKCPACGEIINDTNATKCPNCGYEFGDLSTCGSAVDQLNAKLEQIDRDEQEYNLNKKKKSFWESDIDFDDRRIQVIKSFPIPSDKKDFTDLLILSIGNAKDDSSYFQDAWEAKRDQLIEKARIAYADDAAIMELVEKNTKRKRFGLF